MKIGTFCKALLSFYIGLLATVFSVAATPALAQTGQAPTVRPMPGGTSIFHIPDWINPWSSAAAATGSSTQVNVNLGTVSLPTTPATTTLPPTIGGQAPIAVPTASNIVITRFQDPETKEMREVVVPRSTAESLRPFGPMALAQKDIEYRRQLLEQCGARANSFKQVIRDFPGEAGAFYAGVAITAQLQMKGDPAAIRHFYDQNLHTVMGHVSFGFFMLGSRATTNLLSLIGMSFDPCHEAKTRIAGASRGYAPTALQRRMSFLVGPLSMAGGFLLSSMVNDFASDPNIAACAKGMFTKLNPEQKQEQLLACQRGWDSWVTGEKIANYVPDLLSMSVSSLVQAYGVNGVGRLVGQGAEAGIDALKVRALMSPTARASQIFLRSIEVVSKVSMIGSPVIRFGLQAFGAVVFLTINDYILPAIKLPYEMRRQGHDITESFNTLYGEIKRMESNHWLYVDSPKPPECTRDITPEEYIFGYMTPSYCSETKPKVTTLVTALNDKFKKWRDTRLADAFAAHSHWKDYLIQFQNNYQASVSFYTEIARTMAWKLTQRQGETSEIANRMYGAVPYSGLNLAGLDDVCKLPADQIKILTEAAGAAHDAIEQINRKLLREIDVSEKEWLQKVYYGLSAADCSKRPAIVVNVGRLGFDQTGKIAADLSQETKIPDLTNIEMQARSKQVRDALTLVNQVLAQKGNLNDHGIGIDEPTYAAIARGNPFARLRLILGDPRPLPEGQAYLLELENDPKVINQELKENHPHIVARARTPSMSEFLLASMVCGPDVASVASRESLESNARSESENSYLARTLNFFGLSYAQQANLGSSQVMVDIKYREQEQALIPKIYGISASFSPPNIVTLGDKAKDLCYGLQTQQNIDPALKRRGYDGMLWNIHSAELKVGNETITGFFNIIKRFVNKSIILNGRGNDNFTNWWTETVNPHVIHAVDLFRQDFQRIVQKQFIPAFTDVDGRTYNDQRFEKGVANSILQQARLNLVFVSKGLFPPKTLGAGDQKDTDRGDSDPRAAFKDLSHRFLKQLQLQTALFGNQPQQNSALEEIEKQMTEAEKAKAKKDADEAADSDDDAEKTETAAFTPASQTSKRFQKAFETNSKVLNDILAEIAKMQPQTQGRLNAEAMQNLKELTHAALSGLASIVTETSSYFGIVDTVRFDGLD